MKMTKALMRILFASAFGLTALVGAIALQWHGQATPEWLIALIGAAGGYIFGHTQENGINGQGKKPEPVP